jgi:hypothetical protein
MKLRIELLFPCARLHLQKCCNPVYTLMRFGSSMWMSAGV